MRDLVVLAGRKALPHGRRRVDAAFDVAQQVVDAVVADRDAEVLRRHVLELMRLVEDCDVAVRNHSAVVALSDGRIREQQVFSAVLPCSTSIEEIRKLEPAGIVLSGGPSSVYDAEAPKCDPKVLAQGIPVLGICYGMQWIAVAEGAKVEFELGEGTKGPQATNVRVI